MKHKSQENAVFIAIHPPTYRSGGFLAHGVLKMRRSHEGLRGIIKDHYLNLPKELEEFNYYYCDGDTGHVIMAIPECLLEEAEKNTDLDMFECPFPVKYVLENGYRIYKDHVICEGKYDMIFGLMIDKKWYEI